ncbi:MAG: UDP-N-acetylmuramate dehydrogenase [Gammaproteobacteria bacterium]|nr:UDP-N-acetylmuramate dehydrogenase [Gammaproteobacteria bacterium]
MSLPIKLDASLKAHNSFGVDCQARYLAQIGNSTDLSAILNQTEFKGLEKLVLGGGSNILFTENYPGLILKIEIPGIDIVNENSEYIFLKVGAGVNWHEFVNYCLKHNYAGVENLSLIPGTIGAAPVQNIGAYGAELADIFVSLTAIDLITGKINEFDKMACQFSYRDSYFKQHKNRYIITDVTLQLNKKPKLNTHYAAINETLAAMQIKKPSIKNVSDAIIKIRQQKLPDPSTIGNAGSFFKNPIISKTQFEKLLNAHAEIPHYPTEDKIKIPAVWLIEQCDYKGKRYGEVGIYKNHAVVLVNHGDGSGQQIKDLALEIQAEIFKRFTIKLIPEVNII